MGHTPNPATLTASDLRLVEAFEALLDVASGWCRPMTDAKKLSEIRRLLEDELRALQVQVTISLEEAAKVPAPPRKNRSRCPECGIERPTHALNDHLEAVHGLIGRAAS